MRFTSHYREQRCFNPLAHAIRHDRGRPWCKGHLITVDWRDIERANGRFDWRMLDARYEVDVRVVYLDEGRGKWAIEYDAVSGPRKTALEVRQTGDRKGNWGE
ncbi:MAG: hypothetical protein ACE15B_00270 [Bryobacteraceae bacterium]